MMILLMLPFSAGAVLGETEFQAIPADAALKYHFDLSRRYYASEEAFQKDLTEARKIAGEIQPYKGKVTASGAGLYDLAIKLERMNLLSQKMTVYRYLSFATNTKLEPQMSATDRDLSDIASTVAFVNTELRQLSESDLQKLIGEKPELAQYRFYLQQNTRYKPYTLSADQEQLLSRLSPELYSWQNQFFQRLLDRTKFSEIKTENGTFNVYRDRSILSKEKDRNLRKEALLKLYEEYSASSDLFGFLLIKTSNALNSGSSVRNFKDGFDSSLFDAYLTEQQADTFYAEIGKYAPLMKRYIQARKNRIRAVSGIDPVEPWDMEVVAADYKRPQFTIAQTSEILKKALAFHGDKYSADLTNLLDPANGRLDIVKGENRVPGAFAWGYYGAPFVFYSFTFHGYMDDVLTLAHEGGHVVHYDLIQENKVPPVYFDGPSYFTESFAMLNEFVTAEYLYRNASNKEDKIFYLEQWLSVALRRFFDIVMRSQFEYTAYKKIQAGQIADPDQVHALWKEIGLQYVGEDYNKYDFLKYNWSFTPHFFGSPRYYINYLFANLMAISYYQKHTGDPGFDARYVELMSGGFPDTPVNLLQKHLNLNPFDPANVKGSMQILEQRLTELETLYK